MSSVEERSHDTAPKTTDNAPGRSGNGSADSPLRVWLIRGLIAAGLAACLVIILGPFTRGSIGGAAIAMMLMLIFLRVPIGIALAAPGMLGLYGLHGMRSVQMMFSNLPYETVASWELSVIPMFVFMGLLLWKSGVTEQLYTAARSLLGWLPGGLAIGTNGAGAGLAAVSGSTVGSIHALARIGIPEMLQAGYDRRLAVGSVIVAGLPGQIIPPSIFLVIYAGLAEVPVGPQLIAGIVPGLLLAACFGLTVFALCTTRPGLVGGERGRLKDVFTMDSVRQVRTTWPLPVLIVLVLGGMYSGIVTVTEAGALGALGALLLTLWYRRGAGPFRTILEAAMETLKSMGTIFFLFIGAMALSRLLAVSGIGPGFADWVTGMDLNRIAFLLVIMIGYLIMGTFMDPLSMMLLTVPLLVPVLDDMGVSPIWFGIFVVILAEAAIVTPPVGVLTYIVGDIVKEPSVNLGHRISLGDIFRGIAWFLPTVVIMCVILILIPGLATFLPGQM